MADNKIKVIHGFYIDPYMFPVDAQVLIHFQIGVIAVCRPEGMRPGHVSAHIQYMPARYNKQRKPKVDEELACKADIVLMLFRDGTLTTVKDEALVSGATYHPAVRVVQGSLWAYYQAGELETVDPLYNLDLVEMRAIAGAVLQAGSKMEPVCDVLGVTRHALRRALTKYGMPQLAHWREQVDVGWRKDLAVFARGGKPVIPEERNGDLGEQLKVVEPVTAPSVPPGPAALQAEPGPVADVLRFRRGPFA